jgi:hypothetical protein
MQIVMQQAVVLLVVMLHTIVERVVVMQIVVQQAVVLLVDMLHTVVEQVVVMQIVVRQAVVRQAVVRQVNQENQFRKEYTLPSAIVNHLALGCGINAEKKQQSWLKR